jgi:ketosteroid isomerase-like protein
VRVLTLFTLLTVIVPAIAVAAPRPSAALQPVKSDQDVLIELEKSWNEAFYRKDVKFIESILADEFMSTYEDGSRADKKKELALTAAFDQQVVEAVQDGFTVKIFGDTAVVWFTLHLVGIKQGQKAELTMSYTDVWILRKGSWLCVSAHSTRVTAK